MLLNINKINNNNNNNVDVIEDYEEYITKRNNIIYLSRIIIKDKPKKRKSYKRKNSSTKTNIKYENKKLKQIGYNSTNFIFYNIDNG